MDIAPAMFVAQSCTKPKQRHNRTRLNSFLCEECGQYFSNFISWNKHQTRMHQLPSMRKEKSLYVCPICFVAQRNWNLFEKHLLEVHEQKLECERFVLQSFNEFEEWKKQIEETTNTRFRKGRHTRIYRTMTFYCNRSGQIKQNKHVLEQRRRSIGQGSLSIRIGARCPASMHIRYNAEETEYQVEYWATHLGHDFNLNQAKLREQIWKRTSGPKQIPRLLAEDQTMMEHDYFSWCDLPTCDDENQENSHNNEEKITTTNYNETEKTLKIKKTTSMPKMNEFTEKDEFNDYSDSSDSSVRFLRLRNNIQYDSSSIPDDDFANVISNENEGDESFYPRIDTVQQEQQSRNNYKMNQSIAQLDCLLSDVKNAYHASQVISQQMIQSLNDSIEAYNQALLSETLTTTQSINK